MSLNVKILLLDLVVFVVLQLGLSKENAQMSQISAMFCQNCVYRVYVNIVVFRIRFGRLFVGLAMAEVQNSSSGIFLFFE
jgi:hypothetical protein